MKTRIYAGRDLIGRFNCDGRNYTRFQIFKMKLVKTIKRTFVVMGLFAGLGWAYYFGSMFAPVRVQAIDKPVYVIATGTAPVLERIAKCESGGSQTENGQIQINVNKNGSVDIGKFQINLTTWGKTATKMGYDLTKESDNEAFARWIYENKGTQDWSASQHCWYK